MEEKEKRDGRKSTATIRKASKKGEVTQKMVSFRLDADLLELLQQEQNKGRLINNLLRKHYKLPEG